MPSGCSARNRNIPFIRNDTTQQLSIAPALAQTSVAVEKLTREQALIATLIQLLGVGVGLYVGSKRSHPVVGFLLGSFSGSAASALYIYFSTPPSDPAAIAANAQSGALPRPAT